MLPAFPPERVNEVVRVEIALFLPELVHQLRDRDDFASSSELELLSNPGLLRMEVEVEVGGVRPVKATADLDQLRLESSAKGELEPAQPKSDLRYLG